MSDFWWGFIVGLVTAGVMGSAWQSWGLTKKWNAMTKPQKIEVSTSKTPWQVITTALKAGCVLIIVLIMLLVILWLLLGAPT